MDFIGGNMRKFPGTGESIFNRLKLEKPKPATEYYWLEKFGPPPAGLAKVRVLGRMRKTVAFLICCLTAGCGLRVNISQAFPSIPLPVKLNLKHFTL